MLQRPAIDKIITILKKDARRALRMRVPGFPRPYYSSFLLRDTEWFNTWAASGSTYRRRSDRTRNVFCDIRVGSYRRDQVTDGGLKDNDEERDSVALVSVPIDDRNYDGLRIALWRLSEARFREALTDFSEKESQRITTVDPNRRLPSFVPLKSKVSIRSKRPESVDEEYWTKFCRRISRWVSQLQHVSTSSVEFDSNQVTKIFVSTEGRTIVQHEQIFALSVIFGKRTKEGSTIEQELVINTATLKDLPDTRTFKRQILQKHQQLLKLLKARAIHSFSGPVLLYPVPAGLLFHEAVGHRLEGSRLLSSGEGQTFRGAVGKKLLNVDVTIRDNPKLKNAQGVRCVGAYDFDDEGTPAKSVTLIENGTLKRFLTSRAAIPGRSFSPTGHGRNRKYERPISRMAVTIVEARDGLAMEQLKALLIEEIKRQNKPFGMIVYETSGGETETATYNFQAFSGEVSYATLIYPNGREEVIRGVNFVSTPLQALNNIIAVGDKPVVDNGYCGAESGLIPVTTISPAVLLNNLELQAKEEVLQSPYLLPRPKTARPKN